MGSWLVSRLLDDGEDVAVLDRAAHPDSRFARCGLGERTRAVRADLADRESLVRALEGVGAVFHLAGQPLVGEADRDPVTTLETNVGGVWRLLDAAREAGAERIVLASSYLAYGRHPGGVYREDQPLWPTSPYETSQAAGDMIAGAYASTYELGVGVLRLGNVYGGGDTQYSRIVPDAARALAEGRAPVIRSDGTPERDFLYVEDAVDAYLAVARSLPEHRGRAWNAGAGEAVSILEVVRRLIRASGRDVEPEVKGAPGLQDRQVLDAARIRAELGWAPRHDLDEGLAKTWAWYAEALSARPAPHGGAGRR
jgi:CDP-glucose 4,6-dehydratase